MCATIVFNFGDSILLCDPPKGDPSKSDTTFNWRIFNFRLVNWNCADIAGNASAMSIRMCEFICHFACAHNKNSHKYAETANAHSVFFVCALIFNRLHSADVRFSFFFTFFLKSIFMYSRILCWYLAHALLPWQRAVAVIWGDVLRSVSAAETAATHVSSSSPSLSLVSVSIQARISFRLHSVLSSTLCASHFNASDSPATGNRDDSSGGRSLRECM